MFGKKKNEIALIDEAEIGQSLAESMAKVDMDLQAEKIDKRKTFAEDEVTGMIARREHLSDIARQVVKIIADNTDYLHQLTATVQGIDQAIETIGEAMGPKAHALIDVETSIIRLPGETEADYQVRVEQFKAAINAPVETKVNTDEDRE